MSFLAVIEVEQISNGVERTVYVASWIDAPCRTIRLDLARRFTSESEAKHTSTLVGYPNAKIIEDTFVPVRILEKPLVARNASPEPNRKRPRVSRISR